MAKEEIEKSVSAEPTEDASMVSEKPQEANQKELNNEDTSESSEEEESTDDDFELIITDSPKDADATAQITQISTSKNNEQDQSATLAGSASISTTGSTTNATNISSESALASTLSAANLDAAATTIDIDKIGKHKDTPITELDLDQLQSKPWRLPGADITDYFNFGFNEYTWIKYCSKQDSKRSINASQTAAALSSLLSSTTCDTNTGIPGAGAGAINPGFPNSMHIASGLGLPQPPPFPMTMPPIPMTMPPLPNASANENNNNNNTSKNATFMFPHNQGLMMPNHNTPPPQSMPPLPIPSTMLPIPSVTQQNNINNNHVPMNGLSSRSVDTLPKMPPPANNNNNNSNNNASNDSDKSSLRFEKRDRDRVRDRGVTANRRGGYRER